MNTSLIDKFDFKLDSKLIAQVPASPRENARLLVYNRMTGKITDDYFYNLLNHLPPDTTLVLNNSKVEKARLKFAKHEVFITDTINKNTIKALVFPGKKFKVGCNVLLAPKIEAEVKSVLVDGQRILKFNFRINDIKLDKYRQTPFPPYIKANEKLADEYQTVYAKELGSKAAPTAGLHFGSSFLEKARTQIEVAEITLHVGLGTFAPLTKRNIDTKTLHEEFYQINPKTAKQLNSSTHITAVGTTTVRTLESNKTNKFYPKLDKTTIFIQPGFKFKAVDALVTNFHLPNSSLLMLVGAFMGVEELKMAYDHAIKQQYRFYSFGDAMLIL